MTQIAVSILLNPDQLKSLNIEDDGEPTELEVEIETEDCSFGYEFWGFTGWHQEIRHNGCAYYNGVRILLTQKQIKKVLDIWKE